MTPLDLSALSSLVRGDGVAIRARQRLQPAGGAGDKLFPPTYATDQRSLKYAVEHRLIDGEEVPCVLLDSVASQANRVEEALLAAWEDGTLDFPVIGVDFSGYADLADIGTITTLQAPHRIADAILRDAIDAEGATLFRDTLAGRAYTSATTKNATAVYELCPTALIFGVWDSTGPRGGMGAKFQRALVSEIVGVGARPGVKVSSRIDPLGVQANVPVYQRATDRSDWTIDPGEAATEKGGKPVLFSRSGADGKGKASSVNHSNIAPSIDDSAGGITVDHALHTVVLSLPALRRLRFRTTRDGAPLADASAAAVAARTALAALAIAGILLQRAHGYDLRSRCLLVPEGALTLEIIHGDGRVSEATIGPDEACALVRAAAKAAAAVGLAWERTPIRLVPAPKLAALVSRSRELALAGGEGES